MKITGCNDCHTAGYTMTDGKIPVSQWLKGDHLGWRGPWGSTYASNLRLFIHDLTEQQWIHTKPRHSNAGRRCRGSPSTR